MTNSLLRQTTAGPVLGFADTHPIRSRSPALEGTEDKGGREPVYKWLAIPYAQARRFERPSPPDKWEHPLKAFEYGSCFPQSIDPFEGLKHIHDRTWIPQSENSHYVNVFAPADTKPGDDLRVMVWVHGGGLEGGSSTFGFFDATELIRKNVKDGLPAVVVTFEYRLNVFGFASHRELAKDDPDGLCGNYGLYDCVAAFRWIQENIKGFGGNPDNVTAFGESAGAFIISQLLVYTRAVLFQRAIMQSAAASTMMQRPLDEAYPIWNNVIKRAGCSSVDELRKVDATKLLEAHLPQAGFGPVSATMETGPKAVWDELTIDKLKRGEWAPCIESIVIGINGDEGTLWLPSRGLCSPEGWKLALGSYKEAIQPAIEKYYLPRGVSSLPAPTNYIDAPVGKLFGDQLFYHPVCDQILAMSSILNTSTKKPCKVYSYKKNVRTLAWIPAELGFAHSTGVAPAFYIKDHLNETELKAADKIVSLWAQYSATGSPGKHWPAATPDAPVRLLITEDGSTKTQDPSAEYANRVDLQGNHGIWGQYIWAPHDASYKLWQPYFLNKI